MFLCDAPIYKFVNNIEELKKTPYKKPPKPVTAVF